MAFVQRISFLIPFLVFFSFTLALPQFPRGLPVLPATPSPPGPLGPPGSPGPSEPSGPHGPPDAQFEVFTINNNFETDENDVPIVGTIGAIGVYNLLYWNMVGGDAQIKRKAKMARNDSPIDVNILDHGHSKPNVHPRQQTGLISVIPHSPPNIAGWAVRSELENGTPYISCNYETSTIDHFDLYIPEEPISFYYGCVTDPDSDVALPATCTITATGYNMAGDVVARQQFTYVWEHGLSQQMSPGKFDTTFTNLYKVEFQTEPALLFGTVLDNVITRVYQRKH